MTGTVEGFDSKTTTLSVDSYNSTRFVELTSTQHLSNAMVYSLSKHHLGWDNTLGGGWYNDLLDLGLHYYRVERILPMGHRTIASTKPPSLVHFYACSRLR